MNQFKNIDYQVLESIVNQILFNNPAKPNFENDKIGLSIKFLETIKKSKDDSNIFETYIGNQVETVSNHFDREKRSTIGHIILGDPIYVEGTILITRFELVDKNTYSNQQLVDALYGKIADYVIKKEVNYYVKRFFAIFFVDLIYSRFIFDSEITKNEYLDILSKYTKGKTLV